MKKLIKLLVASFCLMTLLIVISMYKESDQSKDYLEIIKNAYDSTQSALNFDDILKKVSQPENETSTTNNDQRVKSDLKMAEGTGSLISESAKTQDTATKSNSTASDTETHNFSEEMYPYRAMLTSTQKTVYDQVYNNALHLVTTVNISSKIDKNGLTNIMTAVYNDHPELFWMDTSYSYGYTTQGSVVSITLEYNETANNISASKNQYENIANTIIAKTSGLANNLEKEKYVYKYLMNIVKYDENSILNQSAYSAIVNGSSVCAGYSRAFQYIMMQIDIPCYFCSGYANNGYHAWNIVKIDDKYYNADLSWDDSLGDATNSYSFEFFNISDSAISTSHTRRDMSIQLPKCK